MAKGSGHKRKLGGTWNIQMTTEWAPTLRALEDYAFSLTEWKPALRMIADKMAVSSKRSIASDTAPDNYKWRELTPEYSRRKGSRAMMTLTGKLAGIAGNANAAIQLLTKNKLVYTIGVPYATTHQFGGFPNAGSGFPGARVRSYLLWGDDLMKVITDTLNAYGEERAREFRRKTR